MVKEIGGVREEYLKTMDQYLISLPGATFLAVLPKGLRMRRKQKAGAQRPGFVSVAENPPGAALPPPGASGDGDQNQSVAPSKVDELLPRSQEAPPALRHRPAYSERW